MPNASAPAWMETSIARRVVMQHGPLGAAHVSIQSSFDDYVTLFLRRFHWRLNSIHHGGRSVHGGHIGQYHRGKHKDDGAPGGQAGKYGSCTAWTKGSLASHTPKGGSDIGALAVLQQHDHNQNRTNNHMNNGYQNTEHLFIKSPFKTWCGRGDLNPHAFRRHPLKMVCLPVPPLPLWACLHPQAQKRRMGEKGNSIITKSCLYASGSRMMSLLAVVPERPFAKESRKSG